MQAMFAGRIVEKDTEIAEKDSRISELEAYVQRITDPRIPELDVDMAGGVAGKDADLS